MKTLLTNRTAKMLTKLARKARQLGIEVLEDRRLLAGSITVEGPNVVIEGTGLRDMVAVVPATSGGKDAIEVILATDGEAVIRRGFTMQPFSGIVFRGYGGNNIFFNKTVFPSVATGGPERDIFHGGPDGDVFYGFDGNDELWGYQGIDVLRGGPGDDALYGGDDIDILYGNENNDRLYGHYGTDFLIGGNGFDVLEGNYGDDYLDAGSNWTGEHVYGGYGADRFYNYVTVPPYDLSENMADFDGIQGDQDIRVLMSEEKKEGGNTQMPQLLDAIRRDVYGFSLLENPDEWFGLAPEEVFELDVQQVQLFELDYSDIDPMTQVSVLSMTHDIPEDLLAAVSTGYSISEEGRLVSTLGLVSGPQDPFNESLEVTMLDGTSILDLVAGPQEAIDESFEASSFEEVSVLEMLAIPPNPISESLEAVNFQGTSDWQEAGVLDVSMLPSITTSYSLSTSVVPVSAFG